MTRAVIAIADQIIVQELRSRLDEVDAEIEVAFVAESTQEMVTAVRSQRPTLVFVHDQLGPASVTDTVRDLFVRAGLMPAPERTRRAPVAEAAAAE